jgi:hypothetical protein
MVVSWLTSQFRTGPKQQPKKGSGLPLYRSTLLISRLGLLAKKARSGLQ